MPGNGMGKRFISACILGSICVSCLLATPEADVVRHFPGPEAPQLFGSLGVNVLGTPPLAPLKFAEESPLRSAGVGTKKKRLLFGWGFFMIFLSEEEDILV